MAADVEVFTAAPPAAGSVPADPRRAYRERLQARQDQSKRLEQHLDRLGLARLGTFALGLVVVWLIFGWQWLSPWWLALPLAVFLGLVFRYDHLWRRWRRSLRAIRYYERGLERLDDRWRGAGHTGARFLREKSLFAADLDLFGEGSLFERICLARTRPGEEMLARWLLQPAAPEEIRARQVAVRELQPLLDLR